LLSFSGLDVRDEEKEAAAASQITHDTSQITRCTSQRTHYTPHITPPLTHHSVHEGRA
jgi:hypothetical protein